jgi:hypothetical protein
MLQTDGDELELEVDMPVSSLGGIDADLLCMVEVKSTGNFSPYLR